MTLQQLREKRAKCVEDMQEVLAMAESEERMELTAEEQEMYAGYESDLAGIKAAIERRESLDAEATDLSVPEASAVKRQAARGIPGPAAKREFESMGEFVSAVVSSYRGRNTDSRLEFGQSDYSAADGQRMDEGSAGGFMVPTKFRDTLLMVDPQQAIIESRSNVMEAGDPPDAAITMPALNQTGDTPGNVYGGVNVDWIGEGDTKPETQAEIREVTWTPHEIAAHVGLTDKLMRNAPAFTQQIELLMRNALMSARETAFLRGDGIAKPLGMINAPATIQHARTTAGEVKYEDIDSMVSKLLMDGSPYWLITQSAYTQLTRLRDPQGQYVWQPNAVEGSPGSLFGYPVFWHQRSPLLGQKGDVVLCNTNPYYIIKNGSGPFVSMGQINDDFTKNRSRIKVFHNVDAKPWLTEPFKQEGGHKVSPFVSLDLAAG